MKLSILSISISLFLTSLSPAFAVEVHLDEGDSRLLIDQIVVPFLSERAPITKQFGNRTLEGIQTTRSFVSSDGLLEIKCSSANIQGAVFDPKCIFTFDLNKSALNTAKMATTDVLLADIKVPTDAQGLWDGIDDPARDRINGMSQFQTVESVVVKTPSGDDVQISRLRLNCKNVPQEKSCRFEAVISR